MAYKKIKCGGDVAKVMHVGSCIWTLPPIQLNPDVRIGDSSNWIQVDIAVPTDKKGYTEITLNYDWLYDAGCADIEFKLSDYRMFGWHPESLQALRKYGNNDGVSGSPTSKIKIESLDEPISNISIKCAFGWTMTSADLKNVGVTAIYTFY